MKKITLIFTMLAIIFGCTSKDDKGSKMEVQSQEPKLKHCIGRSVIELPISFTASLVTTGIFKEQSALMQDEAMDVVVRAGMDASKFAVALQNRKAELETASDSAVDVLREVKSLGSDATIFRVQRIDDAYVSEIFALRGRSVVTARVHSFNNGYLAAEERLIRFAKGINGLDKDGRSTNDQEFCLGTVNISGDFSLEKAGFLFRNGKGTHFDVSIDTYAPDASVPLLQRMSGPDSLLQVFKVNHKVYRSGERTVSGMRAQEWLGSAQTTEDEDASELQFTLETMRPLPNKTAPSIDLTFETAQPLEDGSQTKTLISKDEAIRLWDSVVASLRTAKS